MRRDGAEAALLLKHKRGINKFSVLAACDFRHWAAGFARNSEYERLYCASNHCFWSVWRLKCRLVCY